MSRVFTFYYVHVHALSNLIIHNVCYKSCFIMNAPVNNNYCCYANCFSIITLTGFKMYDVHVFKRISQLSFSESLVHVHA